jgi:hypothetical protein
VNVHGQRSVALGSSIGPERTTTVQLTRAPDDPRLYSLCNVGTLRLSGWTARAATVEADGLTWRITRRGIWQPVVQAADTTGAVVGEFRGRTHRGGELRWFDRRLSLRPDRFWREQRYVLIENGRSFATIEGRGWGSRPVNIAVDDAVRLDPALLLFVAFVVGTLAQTAQAATLALR